MKQNLLAYFIGLYRISGQSDIGPFFIPGSSIHETVGIASNANNIAIKNLEN